MIRKIILQNTMFSQQFTRSQDTYEEQRNFLCAFAKYDIKICAPLYLTKVLMIVHILAVLIDVSYYPRLSVQQNFRTMLQIMYTKAFKKWLARKNFRADSALLFMVYLQPNAFFYLKTLEYALFFECRKSFPTKREEQRGKWQQSARLESVSQKIYQSGC